MMMAVIKQASIVIETEKDAEIELSTRRKGQIPLEVSGGISAGDEYYGPYTVTPTEDEQVLNTAQKVASRDIVIEKIPYYYGRITWDGSVLTVS
jgi:hypothetical protein